MKISCIKHQFIARSISVAKPEVPEGTLVEAHREKLVAVFLPIQRENKGQESKSSFFIEYDTYISPQHFLTCEIPKSWKKFSSAAASTHPPVA